MTISAAKIASFFAQSMGGAFAFSLIEIPPYCMKESRFQFNNGGFEFQENCFVKRTYVDFIKTILISITRIIVLYHSILDSIFAFSDFCGILK